MNLTKSFIQYSNKYFNIRVVIDESGRVYEKSALSFYRKIYKNKYKKYKRDKEKLKIYQQQYGKDNKEKIKKRKKKYYKDNKEKIKETHKKYNKTKQGKEARKKSNSKRRNFGFNPLNNYFVGSHFHHIHINNPNDGYFIPTKLHNSVWHSYKNKESMNKINVEVFKWLIK